MAYCDECGVGVGFSDKNFTESGGALCDKHMAEHKRELGLCFECGEDAGWFGLLVSNNGGDPYCPDCWAPTAYYTVNIELGNDAFADTPGAEIAKILRLLADKLDGSPTLPRHYQTVRDTNGNSVGNAGVTLE